MVWGLFPIDPLPGESAYYIFQRGTYQVGRKGCDIIVNKDKGISRVHAEINVEKMVGVDQSSQRQSDNSSKVRIRDCSKYGTFITTHMGTKEKVHEFPNKETLLMDGNLVAFGTGNARYKFSFVPLVFFTSFFKPSNVNKIREIVSDLGATVTQTWSFKCTHMICDDLTPFNDYVLDAVLARKELVKCSWIETLSGKTVSNDIPSTIMHTPNLMFEGDILTVAQPQSRDQCLEGYTFVLESMRKYRFGEKFRQLLELASAKVVSVESQGESSDTSGGKLVSVIPANNGRAESNRKFPSSQKISEMDLIAAVISGHLDQSVIESALEVPASSCSSDETVVEESDMEEMEAATSMPKSKAVFDVESAEAEVCKVKPPIIDIRTESENPPAEKTTSVNSDKWLRDTIEGRVVVKDSAIASEASDADVIFSQDLIVRVPDWHPSAKSPSNSAIINFKRFRKMSTPSGNSFTNLIPFSKYPYQETDYGSKDVAESYKEEKKRKEMEAMSEELFKYEKEKRPAASGSILRFLTRG